MSKNDNLLREAIADARAVRETAIAHAMLTLKEEFKPDFSRMLAETLREDIDGVAEQKKLDSSGIGAGKVTADSPGPKNPSNATKDSSDIDNPGQEVDTFGEGIEDLQLEPDGDEVPGQAPTQGTVDPLAGGQPQGEDDLDLEAIIRELEQDLTAKVDGVDTATHDTPGVPFGKDPQLDPIDGQPSEQDESFSHVTAGKDVNAGAKIATPGTAPKVETVESSPKEGSLKNGKSMPDKDGFPGGKEVKPGQELKGDGLNEEEVDLEEILREIGVDEDANASHQIAAENVELKQSIAEHREVIKLLRNRINEVTLLNSKLMYTTKVFRTFNLTEGQKRKIVEQFDRATSLREAKLVYTTLAESLNGKTGTSTPRRAVANITEGASAVAASTAPKTTVITEGGVAVSRMQKLAGIRLSDDSNS